MGVSRRKIVAAGALGALGTAVDLSGLVGHAARAYGGPLLIPPPDTDAPPPLPGPMPDVEPLPTTRVTTVAVGPPDAKGYRKLSAGPGENWTLRTDMQPLSLPTAHRRPLLAFAQMSDLHIVDDQSPARTEFLDRYSDPGPPHHGLHARQRPHTPATRRQNIAD